MGGKIHTRALIDLSCEIKFLSLLSHRNIIKLRGFSSEECRNSLTDNHTFVVLDRIYLTLDEQIEFWKSQLKRSPGIFNLSFCGIDSIKSSSLKLDRMAAATDLSSALEYLHRHKIVYRDIKPDNIGFDARGVIKLFDFGLCKELRSKDIVNTTSDEKFYNLTGFVGCMPYMAPEVYFGKPYNLRADVYSFGLLLYEMLCLKPIRSIPKLMDIFGDKRLHCGAIKPEFPIRNGISMTLANLIVKCWSGTSSYRPDMNYIHSILNSELLRLANEV